MGFNRQRRKRTHTKEHGVNMSVLASQIEDYLESSSWIRRMFEAGIELKKKYGQDRVYDFSLGNPDLPPPQKVTEALHNIAKGTDQPYSLGYMPNSGFPEIRQELAKRLSKEQGLSVESDNIIITCGAAGGLNCLFRSVLEKGDQVVCPAPYFVEYGFYAANHGGVLRPVPATDLHFQLDLEAMEEAINDKTRIVLINSPNNPTGQIYSQEELNQLVDILREKNKKLKKPILLVSDEPYRFLTFDGYQVPGILPLYEHSLIISSWSKNLSLAGERIGYVLINPQMPERQALMNALVLTNRILGFVNAPTVGQQILKYAMDSVVDISPYINRRKLMKEILEDSGYEFCPPKGGFYFFPRAPGGNDLDFVNKLQEERVLAVPGSGFGYPGYFRLSFCVPEKVIKNSAQSLAAAFQKTKEG